MESYFRPTLRVRPFTKTFLKLQYLGYISVPSNKSLALGGTLPHSGPGLFAVAKISFLSRGGTYMFWTQSVFTCSKWTVNTIEYVYKKLKKLWNLFKVNGKDEANWRRLIRRRSSHPRCSIKSCFSIFTGIHQRWSLFLKVAGF